MSRAAILIDALDDSKQRSIQYENRVWLRENVEKFDIYLHGYGKCCLTTIWDIAEEWKKEDTILIQNGAKVEKQEEFLVNKEALLLVKRTNNSGYHVLLYSP